jgi:hypothetical protein
MTPEPDEPVQLRATQPKPRDGRFHPAGRPADQAIALTVDDAALEKKRSKPA